MIVITIKKSLLKFIIITFVILLGVSFYVFIVDTEIKSHHSGALIQNQSKLEDTYLSAFLVTQNIYEDIEIFDIGKGSITR